MATNLKQNRVCLRSKNKNLTDFSKVGGLSNHIKLLREIIIFPLLYGELYKHFNVKAPRGVLFFGPPGTGKTLVAGALATELNREGNGKVTFYQRKGADILDKWVGESERKLRDLFHQASKSHPSVIFFDELDGLAPVRSQKNDQVHCSVVATLLALMDGLDNTPGVVVIGATNRIDAIDPALRRPGRFDRELYFPLPSVNARKEILQVHTRSWSNKPSTEFLTQLSELTSCWCGADLQALCAEAFLCCLKRLYPNLLRPLLGSKMKIDADTMMVTEADFLNGRLNLVPTNQRLGNYRVRKLSPFIKPLLQRQLDKIIKYIEILLPQFIQPFKKFLIGSERYAGRLILKGNNQQGLTVHLVPAILQTLEHIPCYILDIPTLFESSIKSARQNLPSILVLSRVDDWWDLIDSSTQLGLTAMLEDLHAGLPLLIIATCNHDLPDMLQNYFYNNSSIVIRLEDPTSEEREQFFAPLFFDNGDCSILGLLNMQTEIQNSVSLKSDANTNNITDNISNRSSTTKTTHKRKSKFGCNRKQNEETSNKRSGYQESEKRKSEQKGSPVPIKRSKLDDGMVKPLEEMNVTKDGITKHMLMKASKPIRKYSNHAINSNSDDILESDLHASIMFPHRYFYNPSEEVMYPSNNYQTLVDLVDGTDVLNDELNRSIVKHNENMEALYNHTYIKQEPPSETSLEHCNLFQLPYTYGNLNDSTVSDVYNLWRRTAHDTSEGLTVGQLELLYDTISACITLYRHKISELIPAVERTLSNFENSNFKTAPETVDRNIN